MVKAGQCVKNGNFGIILNKISNIHFFHFSIFDFRWHGHFLKGMTGLELRMVTQKFELKNKCKLHTALEQEKRFAISCFIY